MKENDRYLSHQAKPVGLFFILLSAGVLAVTLALFFVFGNTFWKIVTVLCGAVLFLPLLYLGVRACLFKYTVSHTGIEKQSLCEGNIFKMQTVAIPWADVDFQVEPYKNRYIITFSKRSEAAASSDAGIQFTSSPAFTAAIEKFAPPQIAAELLSRTSACKARLR